MPIIKQTQMQNKSSTNKKKHWREKKDIARKKKYKRSIGTKTQNPEKRKYSLVD